MRVPIFSGKGGGYLFAFSGKFPEKTRKWGFFFLLPTVTNTRDRGVYPWISFSRGWFRCTPIWAYRYPLVLWDWGARGVWQTSQQWILVCGTPYWKWNEMNPKSLSLLCSTNSESSQFTAPSKSLIYGDWTPIILTKHTNSVAFNSVL